MNTLWGRRTKATKQVFQTEIIPFIQTGEVCIINIWNIHTNIFLMFLICYVKEKSLKALAMFSCCRTFYQFFCQHFCKSCRTNPMSDSYFHPINKNSWNKLIKVNCYTWTAKYRSPKLWKAKLSENFVCAVQWIRLSDRRKYCWHALLLHLP